MTTDGKPMLASATRDDRLALAHRPLQALEKELDREAGEVLARLVGSNDSVLFRGAGRLARELRDASNAFVLDASIADLVRHEVPDAAEPLRYVITMTEQPAGSTTGGGPRGAWIRPRWRGLRAG